MKKKIVVIGAGISGMAAALRLQTNGFDITVIEKNPVPGGKAGTLTSGGFRFDTGPSLLTLPELAQELLTDAGTGVILDLTSLQSSCKYFWHDGTVVNAFTSAKDFSKELEHTLAIPPRFIEAYLKQCRVLYELAAPVFIFSAFHRLKTFSSDAAKKIAKNILKLDAITTLHKRNTSLLHHPKAVQIFDRYATYNGSNPYKAPATLKMIAHLEHNKGAWMLAGGMTTLTETLFESARQAGVDFLFNAEVSEIVLDNKKALGVKTGQRVIEADAVISAVDIYQVYHTLLPGFRLPRRLKRAGLSSSAIVFFWGMKGTFPSLDVHNILFSANYAAEFEMIFKRKGIYEDPTVYIYISSKLSTCDAPHGHENWFVMINSPHNAGQNWRALVEYAREVVVRKIASILKIDVKQHLVYESIANPASLEVQTNSYNGALYGPSSNSKWSAFNRHPGFSRKIKNLFFAGGTVHPGGGIPLCLASAKLAAEEVENLFVDDKNEK